MPSVVLLGDSIFDNAAYVGHGPHLAKQLQDALPAGWRSVLAAVDGAVAADVPRQLRDVPNDAAVLVVSAGGNDVLRHISILEMAARSGGEVLGHLADVADGFERGYRAMLHEVLALGKPTAVCTVYEGNLGESGMQRRAAAALAVFNHRIIKVALEHGLPVIELRSVCDRPEHYANPIEPSSAGGERIAGVIAGVAASHDFEQGRTVVYGG